MKIYFIYKHNIFFLNIYMHVCVYVYLYIHSTHIYYVNKNIYFGGN